MTRKQEVGTRKGVYGVVVDQTEEYMTVVDYASDFANAEGGYVALLYVIEQDFFSNWKNVEETVRREMRAEAERCIWEAAGRVKDKTGTLPMIFIEEGDHSDKIVDVLADNRNMVSLLLAASPNSSKPGPLITYFSGKGVSRLPAPLMVIPGHLA